MYYCGIQNFKPCYPNLRPSGFGFCTDFKYHLNIRVKGTGGFPISFRDIGQGKVISASWRNVSQVPISRTFIRRLYCGLSVFWSASKLNSGVCIHANGWSGWVWVRSIHFQVQVISAQIASVQIAYGLECFRYKVSWVILWSNYGSTQLQVG